MQLQGVAASQSNIELCRRIAARIAATPQQRVTFANFMDWALYEPNLGYYCAPRPKIGGAGDFVTASHFGADFGELLAKHFVSLWQSLGSPDQFQVVEMGAGQGLVAADVLAYLHRCFVQQPASDPGQFWQALKYVIVERSPILRAEQQQILQRFAASSKLTWQTWPQIADESVVGCFFSNELIDALPVHRVELCAGQLQEVYVTLPAGDAAPERPFVEVVADPSTPELATYLAELGFDFGDARYPERYRTEISLATRDWLVRVASKLHQGYMLTIDYGYPAQQYYHPQRCDGTLQCYYQQSHHADPYWAVGYQDLTAHANFTLLEQVGAQQGLKTVGFTQQGLFLMELGLGDRLSALLTDAASDADPMATLQHRDALQALINPLGLGNFGVLLQGKNLMTIHTQSIRGFSPLGGLPW